MKTFWNWLFNPVVKDYTSNPGYIYKRMTMWIGGLTIIIVVFLLIYLDKCNKLSGILTFLSASGASLAGGAAVGFLFGLPRAEKYRYVSKDDTDSNNKNYDYADNTNLEEVSDWLSKIIVGLTLIKLKTIVGWIDLSAHSINNSFRNDCTAQYLNAYVFGYCIIILYFLAGAGLCYLWARTNLSVILQESRLKQANLDNQQLVAKVQALTNPGLASEFNASLQKDMVADVGDVEVPTADFKNTIESVYNSKPVIDKTDLQKGRWGSKAQVDNKVLEAFYDPGSSFIGLYHIKLQVRSLDANAPLTGQIAFFLHDSFPKEIVYAVAVNNKAEIKITAWEAFVTGARLEDKTELELDINTVKGFPDGFYWKE